MEVAEAEEREAKLAMSRKENVKKLKNISIGVKI